MQIQQQEPINDVREYYDAYWSAPVPPRYDPDDVLVGLLARAATPQARCLDVGCGAGQTYAQLVSRRAAAYVGVDVSAKAVELARSTGLEAAVIDDVGALPFENDSFDVAICVEVLEHLFSPERAVSEMRRVLRPGGMMIASAPNSVYWRLRANLLFGIWNPLGDALSIEQPWRDPHVRFFSPGTMRRMLEHIGFSTVEVGAHGGRLLDHVSSRPTNFGVSRAYRRAEALFPALLGATIHAVARK